MSLKKDLMKRELYSFKCLTCSSRKLIYTPPKTPTSNASTLCFLLHLSLPDDSLLEAAGTIPKSRRLTVVMDLPPASKAADTVPIVELAVNLLDVLAGSSLPNDLLKKTVSNFWMTTASQPVYHSFQLY
jgi:hypothetical protein